MKKKNKTNILNASTDRGEVRDVPNPFVSMHRILLQSVGNLPGMLVVILALSFLAASLVGITMVLHPATPPHKEFMPQRLEAIQGSDPIDSKILRGVWSLETPDFAMTISLVDKNKFEWIIKMRKEGHVLNYVRGNYRTVGDILILGARPDMGAPSEGMGGTHVYMPVDIKDINVRVSLDNNRMIWHVPVSEQSCYATHRIRIFDRENQADFVWRRVE